MRSSEKTENLRFGGENPTDTPLKLTLLNLEHDDLDVAIAALLETGRCDDLLITRLKKRKLQIKDGIAEVLASGETGPVRVAQAS